MAGTAVAGPDARLPHAGGKSRLHRHRGVVVGDRHAERIIVKEPLLVDPGISLSHDDVGNAVQLVEREELGDVQVGNATAARQRSILEKLVRRPIESPAELGSQV